MNSGSRIANLDFKHRASKRTRASLRTGAVALVALALVVVVWALYVGGEPTDAADITQSSVKRDAANARKTIALEIPRLHEVNATSAPSSTAATVRPLTASLLSAPNHGQARPSSRSRDDLDADAALAGKSTTSSIPVAFSSESEYSSEQTPLEAHEPREVDAEWRTVEVRAGDSLATIFKRAGLGPRTVYEVVRADESAEALTRIFPGDEISLWISANDGLQAVRYPLSPTQTLQIRRGEDGFSSTIEEHALESRVAHASAVIRGSLYAAAMRAGLDDGLIMELARIFGWDIDFALDLRKGDSFTVLYEELYRDGEKVRNGDILAAEFVNRGESFRAVRYENADGDSDYYTPKGRSMRRAFLRTPLNFARVSSDFNPNRLHPVLGYKRPHLGTDYAAPTGTPVKAAGSGKVIHRGRKGGYGNAIVLQHGTRYTTLYAHLSKFKSGLNTGERVKQGQIIGYVGSSGMVTGPHLHYEFRINGTHRNPRTVELPEAAPIPDKYRADFEATIAPRLAQLDTITRTQVAQAGAD